MKIYDISVTVTSALPVWPGDPAIVLERFSKMEEGEHNNISRIAACVHIGTHMDAPYHFIADGKTIEQIDLAACIGPAQVLELPLDCQQIGAADLQAAGFQTGTQRLLLKTANSAYWKEPGLPFQEDFVALAPDGAEFLVQQGVRLVGIDYFSIAPFGDSIPTHRVLLGAEIVVLEGVDLSAVPGGSYMLCCLPLKLGGSDGAPARAVLLSETA